MSRRVLAAIAATTWLAGCVSILGVDEGDYVEVEEVVCGCTEGGAARAACSGGLAAILRRRPKLEDAILGCVEEHGNKCAELDPCLVREGVCSQEGGECTPASDGAQLALRCCDGLSCGENGKCATGCRAPGDSCADGSSCCSGAPCLGGTCPACGAAGDPCSESFGCCDVDPALVCRVDTSECAQCAGSLEGCTADLPCCDTGECPLTGRCL